MEATLDLRGWDINEIEALLGDWGEPSFRAVQIFRWIQRSCCDNFEAMTNVPVLLRNRLNKAADISLPQIKSKKTSREGSTEKYLLELKDGETLETVLMSYMGGDKASRHTVCVSSQVGCAMSCSFCATALSGFRRNLTTAEILSQAAIAERSIRTRNGEGLTNVVFMGMGEPLLNYAAVIKAIRILSHPQGLNIGLRRITISTCGIVPKIYCLADEGLPLVLAVSLHAAEDFLRNELVPVNKKYPLKDLIEACRYFTEKTGRRVTFEYVLLHEVNDTERQANKLSGLLQGLLANVNLIPFNEIKEREYKRPDWKRISAFKRRLQQAGLNVVVREERGADIEAACGQLRRYSR